MPAVLAPGLPLLCGVSTSCCKTRIHVRYCRTCLQKGRKDRLVIVIVIHAIYAIIVSTHEYT